MSEKDNSREHQTSSDCPDGVTPGRRQHGRRRCQGAYMDGVSGGKGVEPLSRQGNPTQVSKSGQAIRALLIEYPLERMRQRGRDQGGEKDVIACTAHLRVAASGIQPPTDGKDAKYVLVGAPRQRFRDVFGGAAGMRGDGVCNRDVSIGGLYSYKCHAASILALSVDLRKCDPKGSPAPQ
jgi:hypothetical protein